METAKRKVLMLADSPTVATGFAQVARNILKVLTDTGLYDIDIIGINFDGSYYDREKFPYQIYPACQPLRGGSYQDLFGRQIFLDMIGTGIYDLCFIIQDTFIIQDIGPQIQQTNDDFPADKKFKMIYYFPIDAEPKKKWVDNSVLVSDFPVAYTKYALDECLKVYDKAIEGKPDEDKEKKLNQIARELLNAKMNVIYHGVNHKDFYQMEAEKQKELKKKWFGSNADKFIFMNLNRNQPRKDMLRSMMACKRLKEKRLAKGKDDVYFYFHCLYNDSVGINLVEVGKQIGLEYKKDFAFPNPQKFDPSTGFSLSDLNELYNSVDAVFSTTLGEGFGLSALEGMQVGKPILMPDNTSMNEIIGDNQRGFKIASGSCDEEFVALANDNDRVRPLTNIEDMADKMEACIDNPELVKEITTKASEWIKELHWDGEIIGKKWIMLFDEAYKANLKVREAASIDFTQLKRNDLCPICQTKIKNCPHYRLTSVN